MPAAALFDVDGTLPDTASRPPISSGRDRWNDRG